MAPDRLDLNPKHFSRLHDYVAAELAATDFVPVNKKSPRFTRWALRKLYPEIGRLIAVLCADWTLIWLESHNYLEDVAVTTREDYR